MAPPRITGTIDGLPAFDRAFLRVQELITDWRAIFEQFGELFLDWEELDFWHAGTSGGERWKDLTPAYEEYKGRVRPFMPLLRFDDVLYNSLTRKGAEFNVWEVSEQDAAFGTADPKARYHQLGTSRMAARPVVQMNDRRRTELMKKAQAELLKYVRSTGLGTYAQEV